jgi:hypothetical protein
LAWRIRIRRRIANPHLPAISTQSPEIRHDNPCDRWRAGIVPT